MAIRSLAGEDTPIVRGRWPLIFGGISIVCTILYFAFVSENEPEGGTRVGIFFGIMAFFLMLFLMAYEIRKHIYIYKMGPTNTWLTAHIYMGVLAAVLVTLHSGLHTDGTFGAFLFYTFVLTTASGIIGALVYKLTPMSVTKEGRQVALKEDLEASIKKLLEEADKDAAAMSQAYQDIYRGKVRPRIDYPRVAWEYLFTEERALLKTRQEEMDEVKKRVPDAEKYHFSLLITILIERERQAFRLAKMEVMDVWLSFHLPLSGVCLTAVAIHIVAAFYYW